MIFDSPVLDMLALGSIVAVILGVIAPIVVVALLRAFTRVQPEVLCLGGIMVSLLVIAPLTVLLCGIGLWLGPGVIIVPIGGAACLIAAITAIVGAAYLLPPRKDATRAPHVAEVIGGPSASW